MTNSLETNLQYLAEIRDLLIRLLSLFKLIYGDEIRVAKENALAGQTKRKIYDLCDGNHTVQDIALELKQTPSNISQHLSSLLERGLVTYFDKAGYRYYTKILE